MKQLLNTLFVTSEDIYLSLERENVLANRDKTVVARYPLHTLQAIVSFSYAGASPALMGKCAEAGIGLAFCSPHGRFLARTCGESSGKSTSYASLPVSGRSSCKTHACTYDEYS